MAQLSGNLYLCKNPAQDISDSGWDEGFALAFAIFKRAKFGQADGGDKFGLVQGGFEAADGVGLAGRNRHLQNVLGELGNVRNASAAAAEVNARTQIIRQSGLFQILADEVENLFDAQRHDLA